jgi:hypothetical protein
MRRRVNINGCMKNRQGQGRERRNGRKRRESRKCRKRERNKKAKLRCLQDLIMLSNDVVLHVLVILS